MRALDFDDLAKLRLVSNPAVAGNVGYFVLTKINLDKNRYESSIWAVDLSTGEARAITPGPSDFAPFPSPRGDRLAYLSRKGMDKKAKGVGLWAIERGGVARQLAVFPLGVLDVSWSPCGDEVEAPVGLASTTLAPSAKSTIPSPPSTATCLAFIPRLIGQRAEQPLGVFYCI